MNPQTRAEAEQAQKKLAEHQAQRSADNAIALSLACQNVIRYLRDHAYREELDERAAIATGGNITAFAVLIRELREALKPFPETV